MSFPGENRMGLRRHLAVLTAFLALLFQTLAPLSPMPAPRLDSLDGLTVALADLCIAGSAGDGRSSPPKPFHGCQICLTMQIAGQFVAPPAAVLPAPSAARTLAWAPVAPELLFFVRPAVVEPRGPPMILA